MEIPPKLAEIPAKQIEVEVMPPVASAPKIEHPAEGPPIHSNRLVGSFREPTSDRGPLPDPWDEGENRRPL